MTAREWIGWVMFPAGAFLTVRGIVTLHFDGGFILGLALVAAWLVLVGAWRASWWTAPDPHDARTTLDEMEREREIRAALAYKEALDAQRRGAPSAVKAQILMRHADEWERYCKEKGWPL